ncbi:MAG: AraC family transcriptional regulator [Gammaproteobacteria bacterium]|nr:AraC family transcriptional regulator [Gammaproteobacteria bacterium]
MSLSTRRLSVNGLHQVFRMLQRDGLDPAPGLAVAGIEGGLWHDPRGTLTPEQEFALLRWLHTRIDDPWLGLRAGCCYRLSAFGALGSAAQASLTGRDAIRLFLRFVQLTYTYFTACFEETTPIAALRLSSDQEPPDLFRYFLLRDVAFAVTAARDLMPGLARREMYRLELALPVPEDPEPLLRFMECPVVFGTEVTRLCFHADALDEPLPLGNPLTAQLLEEQCLKDLAQIQSPQNIVERVRHQMRQSSQGLPTEEDIAARLAMTGRTLRRHLRVEGVHFQALLNAHQGALARQLLMHSRLSVQQIADRLGYTESASFIRAFRRWTGQSPGAFRQAGKH